MMLRKLAAAVAAVVLLTLALPAATEPTSETYRQLDLFGEVFQRVQAEYVEEVSDQQLIEAAINGMLTALDPHSSYLNPDSLEEMQVQTRGEFGGLGIEVTLENGLVKVVSPIDDTPAARAGIQPGDFITHIDGEQVLGLSLSDAVDRMRGRVGSDIVLSIRREGEEPLELTLTRAVITIKSVRWRVEGNVGYVRVTTFNEKTDQGVREALASFKDELGEGWKGVVLDLRNNPGGLLNQAVSVSDAFLDHGEIVSTRGRDEENAKRENAQGGDLAEGKPIVVLINGGSASASEIVAGALQDHRRAIIMGTRSFGKGSVQTIMSLGDRGAMRLTTARYYTPSGRSIQATGIEPDILVEQARVEALEPASRRREADLRGALSNDVTPNGEEDDGSTNGEADAAPEQIDDYQLVRALDLLHGLALFGGKAVN